MNWINTSDHDHDELLKHAARLPEVRALVEAAREAGWMQPCDDCENDAITGRVCPVCMSDEEQGHWKRCKLGIALAPFADLAK